MAQRPVTLADITRGHVSLEIEGFDRLYFNVILSFRVSQGCDLRRPVVDSVVDGTAAACSRVDYRSGLLPDRVRVVRWSPSARASWRRSRPFSSASAWLRCGAAVSRACSDALVDRWLAGTGAPGARLVGVRSCWIWSRMSGWV